MKALVNTQRVVLSSLVALTLGAATVPAHADTPQPSSSPTVSEPQYKDAVKVSWDGESYTHGIAGSFVGTPVAVPGDSASRTLSVLNDGPSKGNVRVSIINVSLKSPQSADVDAQGNPQGNFYDDVTITGTTQAKSVTSSLTELDQRKTTVLGEFPLDAGSTSDITVGYNFPRDATSGNKSNVESRMAQFDVLIEISGEELPTDVITPDVEPTPGAPQPGDNTGQVVTTPNKNNDHSPVHIDVAPNVIGEEQNPISELGVVPLSEEEVQKSQLNTGNSYSTTLSDQPLVYTLCLLVPLAFIGYAMHVGNKRRNHPYPSSHTGENNE